MKIIPLSEGSFTIDATKDFIAFNSDTDQLNERPAGSLLVEIQPFAVITGSDIILFDTGLGFTIKDEMQLHTNLRKNNIDPSSVTKVFLSHLHKDHGGGISKKNADGSMALTFPNATYYVHEKEIEFAFNKGEPSYVSTHFSILVNNRQLSKLQGSSGKVGNVTFEVSGGHCPYHTVYWITEQSEIAFFGGDVAPQLQQMKHKFVAKYDSDGKLSMELRAKWWVQAKQEGWVIMFYHDIKTPFYP